MVDMLKGRIEVEPMTKADLDAVVEIESLSQPSPWSRQIFAEELAREWARLQVIRNDGRAVAFSNYWLVHDEVHLLNIGTHPDHRRQGYARALMEALIQTGQSRRASLVTLEVRRSNLGAISLYEALSFKNVGVRRGYYAEDREDALVMALELKTPECSDRSI
jgi:ribosomal-protein-alanine N-acetyltransferase